MIWLRIVLVILGLIEGSWMAFDGTRALVVGDYFTPAGARAGELGPWNHVVRAVGIPPRSTAMKLIFITYGVSWLVIALALAFRVTWASKAMLIAVVATLWYLPVGTIFGILQLAGLILLRRTT